MMATANAPKILPTVSPPLQKKARHHIDSSLIQSRWKLIPAGEIRLVSIQEGRSVVLPPIPLKNFELALECSGSYLLHCALDKSTQGREGRELLMKLLEPLLGREVDYSTFMMGVNIYCQSRRFKENMPDTANTRRFLEEVRKGWKKSKVNTWV